MQTADTLLVDVNHLCLRKGPSGSQIVFCVNNQSSKGPNYQISLGGFSANDVVVEVLTCTTVTATGGGNITAYMGAGEPKVFFPAKALNGTGLCPTTTAAKPSAAPGSASALPGLMAAIVLGWLVWLL